MDYFLHQPGYDTFFHLATEEYLLKDMPRQARILLLWQSDNAVVLGKHQNPWLECDMSFIRENTITLARRLSGGGTVYHDRGNLNFAFIIPKQEHEPKKFSRIILNALHKLGIPAEMNERHDLILEEKKISGNAFAIKKDRALHHGTLLIHSDLDKMQSLKSSDKLETKAGVRSHPSPVTNIYAFDPSISISKIADAIRTEWGSSQPLELDDQSLAKISSYAEGLRSWDWVYGNTPPFSLYLQEQDVEVQVRHACVEKVVSRKKKETLFMGQPKYKFNKKNLESLLKEQAITQPGFLQGFVF